MRNLPGRKKDIKDAEWIAQLLQHGLLSNSYIPEKRIRSLREMSRLKRSFVNDHTSFCNRLEKFLQHHGFKLSSVVNDILGVSSRRMLDLLVEKGSLSFVDVQDSIRRKMKHTPIEIHAAIVGKLEQFDRSVLKQLLDWLDQLDVQIRQLTDLMQKAVQSDEAQLMILCSIPGIDVNAGLSIMAEIGPSPHKDFVNSGRLCSWAGLVPRNDESAGKISSRRILNGNPYIKSILVQTAWAAVTHRKCSFSCWFWSHQANLGRKKAIIAVARKMLSLIYTLLQSGEFYDPNRGLLKPRSDKG